MCGKELLTVHNDRVEMYADCQTISLCVQTIYLCETVHDCEYVVFILLRLVSLLFILRIRIRSKFYLRTQFTPTQFVLQK